MFFQAFSSSVEHLAFCILFYTWPEIEKLMKAVLGPRTCIQYGIFMNTGGMENSKHSCWLSFSFGNVCSFFLLSSLK